MAKRRLLSRADRRRNWRFHPGRGRNGFVPRPDGQMEDDEGPDEGRSGGASHVAGYTAQKARAAAYSQALARAGKTPNSGQQNLAKGDVQLECPACDSADSRRLFTVTDRLYGTTRRTFELIECGECRLIRLHPQPAASELRSYYPKDYWFQPDESVGGRLRDLYRRLVLRDHVSFVRRALRNAPEGPVLDVGCGSGLLAGALRRHDIAAFGLDSSPEAAAMAWRLHGVPALCGDLRRKALRPGSFSAVTMFHLLEHVYNPREYLEAARSLLKRNGRLIIQVPNADCWQFRLFGARWNGVDAPRHLHLFREHNLIVLLEYCGFTVTATKRFSLRDNPAGLAITMAPSLDPMARRVRGERESPAQALFRDARHMALVVLSLPFTMAEAAFRAGSTVMLAARRNR